jgi:phage internal scaffolding protein
MSMSEDKIVITVKDPKYPLASVDKKRPGNQVLVDANNKVLKVVTVCGKSLTEQAHRNETNINYILEDYRKTGLLKHAKDYEGKYDDVSVQDFQDAMFLVKRASDMFNDLPNDIRQRFGNDPGQFIQFTQNPENKAEMEKMGIIKGNDGLKADNTPSGAPVVDTAGPDGVVGTVDDVKPS